MADKLNRFAAAAFDDSDDEPVKQQTKTAKKKEERKISDNKPARLAGAKTMEQGGFDVVTNQPSTRGRDGERGRGGRGGRGGDNRGGGRDGERAPERLDAEGNPIRPTNRPRRDQGTGKAGDRTD